MNELEKAIKEIDDFYQDKQDELQARWNREVNEAVTEWNAKGVYVRTDPRHESARSRGLI